MDLDLSSNRHQEIRACAECGKPFKVNSRLCRLLLEDDYSYGKDESVEVPEYDIHAGQFTTSVLIPMVVCSKCFKVLTGILTGADREEEELDLTYKVDSCVLLW